MGPPYMIHWLWFVWCVSVYGLCVSVYGLCVSGYGLCVSVYGLCVSVYGLCVSGVMVYVCQTSFLMCIRPHCWCVSGYGWCIWTRVCLDFHRSCTYSFKSFITYFKECTFVSGSYGRHSIEKQSVNAFIARVTTSKMSFICN